MFSASLVTCLLLLINLSFKWVDVSGLIFTFSSVLTPLIALIYLLVLRNTSPVEQRQILNIALIALYIFSVGIYLLVNLPAAEYMHNNPAYQIVFEDIPKKFFATTFSFGLGFYLPHLLLCRQGIMTMSSKKSVLFMMSCGLSFFIMDYYFLFSELNSIDFQRVFIDSFLICTMLLLLICAFYLACTVPFKKENKRISCLNKALSLYSYLICVAVAILLICVAFQYRLVTLYPHWVVTGNALLFPFVLMVSTLIVELYGLRGNLILTFILVGVQLFFDSVLMLSALLPSPSFFDLTPFYDYVLPRRILTGGINTLIIFLSNGYILDKLSRVPGLKHRVVRIFLANFASATLTCLISYSLMLTGVYTYEQIINLALNAWIFKNGLSIITLPLIIWIYTMLIKHLNAEQPSNKIRYNQEKNPGLSMANKING